MLTWEPQHGHMNTATPGQLVPLPGPGSVFLTRRHFQVGPLRGHPEQIQGVWFGTDTARPPVTAPATGVAVALVALPMGAALLPTWPETLTLGLPGAALLLTAALTHLRHQQQIHGLARSCPGLTLRLEGGDCAETQVYVPEVTAPQAAEFYLAWRRYQGE